MEYIHYGARAFDQMKFQPIRNRKFIKPTGGFWASPENSPRGWKKWCDDEQFVEYEEDDFFRFVLSDSARVLHIRSANNIKDLPIEPSDYVSLWGVGFLDFEAIQKQGYDAIELHISEDFHLYNLMYGWDVDSILIMNPDIVKQVA